MVKRMLWLSSLIIGLSIIGTFYVSCGSPQSAQTYDPMEIQQGLVKFIHERANTLSLEVIYEQGAAPYAGSMAGGKDWDLTQENLEKLFENARNLRTILVPKDLSQMREIPSATKATWTIPQLIHLAETHRTPPPKGDQVTIAVVFVNGEYDKGPNVLGLHPTGYPFVFIFKDKIKNMGGSGIVVSDLVKRHAEQAIVIHELGHSIGLVNNGLHPQSPHEDAEHPKHCANTECVMHWSYESAQAIFEIATAMAEGDRIIVGDECVGDVRGPTQ